MAPARFRVLGPLEVLVAGRPVHVGSRKQRRLLTVLVARSSDGLTTGAVLELRAHAEAASAVPSATSARTPVGDVW